MAENTLVQQIKRQTDYTEDIIIEKLKIHENNIEKIILEYNDACQIPKAEKECTTNQKIFKVIRENMNDIHLKNSSKKQ